MAENIRQRILRQADALVGRDGDDPLRLEAMLRYYSLRVRSRRTPVTRG